MKKSTKKIEKALDKELKRVVAWTKDKKVLKAVENIREIVGI